MSKQRQKGTAFESLIANGLADALEDDRIMRSPLHGANDRGDIANLRSPFGKVAVECKNVKQMALSQWVTEAEVERGNLDAVAGVVIHKRRGKAQFAEQFVTMTVRDFLALGWGVSLD